MKAPPEHLPRGCLLCMTVENTGNPTLHPESPFVSLFRDSIEGLLEGTQVLAEGSGPLNGKNNTFKMLGILLADEQIRKGLCHQVGVIMEGTASERPQNQAVHLL